MNRSCFFKKSTVFIASTLMALTGCSGTPSISVLPSSDRFTQNGVEIAAKMDIVWVIDSSGSMANEQLALRDNFNEFIKNFVGKGYDFKMTVISTDAWYTLRGDRFNQAGPYSDFDTPIGVPGSGFGNNSDHHPDERCEEFATTSSKFLDGNLTLNTRSGYPVISSDDPTIEFNVDVTPPYAANNVLGIFATNSNVGTKGCYIESGLRSIEVALNDPGNSGFLRDDAHLAVIVVSDEEDAGMNDANEIFTPDTVPLQHYHDFLTAKSPFGYSFHSIIGKTAGECSEVVSAGDRYAAFSNFADNETKGVVASLCGDFAVSLEEIAQTIIETSVEFKLTATPENADGAGIIVSIKSAGDSDFKTVPNNSQNGWTYNSERNSIIFHGTEIPAQNSEINIVFDPDGL